MECLKTYCGINVNKHKIIDKKLVWEFTFGKDATYGYDFAGRLVYNDNFYITHIIPVSMGGTNDLSNLIACSAATYDEKGNNYPVFNVNKNLYIVETHPMGHKKIRKVFNQ